MHGLSFAHLCERVYMGFACLKVTVEVSVAILAKLNVGQSVFIVKSPGFCYYVLINLATKSDIISEAFLWT